MEESLQHPKRTLQVPGYAIWTHRCPCCIPGSHQLLDNSLFVKAEKYGFMHPQFQGVMIMDPAKVTLVKKWLAREDHKQLQWRFDNFYRLFVQDYSLLQQVAAAPPSMGFK